MVSVQPAFPENLVLRPDANGNNLNFGIADKSSAGNRPQPQRIQKFFSAGKDRSTLSILLRV